MASASARSGRRIIPDNPFVGLRPYESDESLLFFGRGEQTTELMERLHKTRFVAVVGSSGCGKSSLIRAGLIPNLKAGFLTNTIDRWQIAVMKPGETPLYCLAAALTAATLTEDAGEDGHAAVEALLKRIRERGLPVLLEHIRNSAADSNFLLLVDQFEEIFHSVKRGATPQQVNDATDFVALMLELAEQTDVPAYVVMSMRTDFLGDCDFFFGLPESLNRSQYLVPRLTRQQRREVIEGPIGLYQKTIQPDLLDRILNDAGDRADQLPVLQHALMRTWQEFLHDTGCLEVALKHYLACGGIADALNRHAEQAMNGMSLEEKSLTEKMFRALTDTDDHGRQIRRPLLLSQLKAITGSNAESILKIVERFREDNRSFLVLSETETVDDPRIDISHEALVRQWKSLGGWVEVEAQSKEEYLRLVQTARLFQKGKEGLMNDPALKVAEEWRAKQTPTKEWASRFDGDFQVAMDFLKQSLSAKKSELAGQRRRRLALLFASLALAVGSVTYYKLQAGKAEEAHRFLKALSAQDPLVRALLVTELKGSSAIDASLASVQQVAAAPIPLAVLGERDPKTPNPALIGAWFLPDGKQVATVSELRNIRLWTIEGKGNPRPLPLPGTAKLTAVAASRDQRVAAGFLNGDIRIIRSEDQSSFTVTHLDHPQQVTALAFDPGGEKLLAGYADYTVRVWDRHGKLLRTLGNDQTRHTGQISAVQFDPFGKRVMTASWDGTAKIWDAVSGKLIAVLDGQHGSIYSASFSPDGKWVLCGYQDRFARIWSSDGKGTAIPLEGHSAALTSVAFGVDPFLPGHAFKVVTGSEDLSARIWSLRIDGDTLIPVGSPAVLQGHSRTVAAVAFNADGSKVVTASDDGTARIWSTESMEPRVLGKHERRVQGLALSPDGKRVATASDDATARVWTLDGSAAPLLYKASDNVRSVGFSGDGTRVVAGSLDNTFVVWHLNSAKTEVFKEDNEVLSVAFKPDGTGIVTGTRGNLARVWSTDDRSKPLYQLLGHTGWVWRAVYSPEGARIATASMDATAQVWIAGADPKLLWVLKHAKAVLSAAFSPDSSSLATGSEDFQARIWDLNATPPSFRGEFPHSKEVWSVAFDSVGRRLITGSMDGTAAIWSINNNRDPHLVLTHPTGLRAAAFQPPDDRFVVTGAEDGVVRLWRTALADLVSYLADATTACLSTTDRMRYLEEPESKARGAYEKCEADHGRTEH